MCTQEGSPAGLREGFQTAYRDPQAKAKAKKKKKKPKKFEEEGSEATPCGNYSNVQPENRYRSPAPNHRFGAQGQEKKRREKEWTVKFHGIQLPNATCSISLLATAVKKKEKKRRGNKP